MMKFSSKTVIIASVAIVTVVMVLLTTTPGPVVVVVDQVASRSAAVTSPPSIPTNEEKESPQHDRQQSTPMLMLTINEMPPEDLHPQQQQRNKMQLSADKIKGNEVVPDGDSAPKIVTEAEFREELVRVKNSTNNKTKKGVVKHAFNRSAINAQRVVLPAELLPWVGDAECCAPLRQLANTLRGLPNDIQLLLPVIGAYQRERRTRTVVELGSRLGITTATLLKAMSYHPGEKRFAVVDLELRRQVRAMLKCERECSARKFPNRVFEAVEGDDLTVGVPFLSRLKSNNNSGKGERRKEAAASSRPIDLLFIDSWHNAQQLSRELSRYSKHVERYILLHDTSGAFKFANEKGSPAATTNSERKSRHGLRAAIAEFLLNSNADHDGDGGGDGDGTQWIEEASFPLNNGLVILRRGRAFKSADVRHITASNAKPFVGGFVMEPRETISWLLDQERWMRAPSAKECSAAFQSMSKKLGAAAAAGRSNNVSSSSSHSSPLEEEEDAKEMCKPESTHARTTQATRLYKLLITQPDDLLPIASTTLPLIMVHVASAVDMLRPTAREYHRPNSVHRRGSGGRVAAPAPAAIYVYGCEISVVIAALMGADQAGKSTIHFVAALGGDPIGDKSHQCHAAPPQFHDVLERFNVIALSELPGQSSLVGDAGAAGGGGAFLHHESLMDVFVVSAEALANFPQELIVLVTRRTSHRIVVYGTSLFNVAAAHAMFTAAAALDDSTPLFELKTVLTENVGFAVWERTKSTALSYIPEGKRKFSSNQQNG